MSVYYHEKQGNAEHRLDLAKCRDSGGDCNRPHNHIGNVPLNYPIEILFRYKYTLEIYISLMISNSGLVR